MAKRRPAASRGAWLRRPGPGADAGGRGRRPARGRRMAAAHPLARAPAPGRRGGAGGPRGRRVLSRGCRAGPGGESPPRARRPLRRRRLPRARRGLRRPRGHPGRCGHSDLPGRGAGGGGGGGGGRPLPVQQMITTVMTVLPSSPLNDRSVACHPRGGRPRSGRAGVRLGTVSSAKGCRSFALLATASHRPSGLNMSCLPKAGPQETSGSPSPRSPASSPLSAS